MMDVRPAFVVPMKAVLTAERPAGPGWVFERKLDGIRCVAVKDRGGRTRLYSRNELSLNDRYASLAAALDADAADGFVIDGEAVAFVGGRDRFGGGEGGELFYYVFDVLVADGRDVRSLRLEERRAVLEGVLRWRDRLRMTEQMTGDGAVLLDQACRDGWEGLIAKRLGTPYVSTRSRDWLKLKCSRAQELVIGGFTAPRGSRTDLGALLVGHFDGDRFRYAGKVGTGFTRATLRELSERLAPLVRQTSPFEPDKGVPARRDVGPARTRGTDRVHAMDPRRPPAPSRLPRPALRQARAPGRARRALTATAPNRLVPARGAAITSSASARHGMA
jgi:DNA ligase D-like protein (predicted ligase)